MRYIGIIDTTDGRISDTAESLAKKIEGKGYKLMKQYRTRVSQKETDMFSYITEDKFNKLFEKGEIIDKFSVGDIIYGVARPFGSDKFVAIIREETVSKLIDEFGKEQIMILEIHDGVVTATHGSKDDIIKILGRVE